MIVNPHAHILQSIEHSYIKQGSLCSNKSELVGIFLGLHKIQSLTFDELQKHGEARIHKNNNQYSWDVIFRMFCAWHAAITWKRHALTSQWTAVEDFEYATLVWDVTNEGEASDFERNLTPALSSGSTTRGKDIPRNNPDDDLTRREEGVRVPSNSQGLITSTKQSQRIRRCIKNLRLLFVLTQGKVMLTSQIFTAISSTSC